MARLRIRIELSRGGLGVPLPKVASVIAKSQKFLDLLGEDVHIKRGKGEWLGCDFDRESLNFTAEYIGAVTANQVEAFNAAFDGTTSLRRDTIAQFASITDAIGEDEIIGFGLFDSDESAEPTEWRCLSRRDALRIAEGIQLLLETDQESRLPEVRDPSLGARIFGERREWGVERGKSSKQVRELEASLSGRIQRVENQVEQHSGLIRELGAQSATTETSFRNLLTTVETFCEQATRRIETVAPAALPGWAPEPRSERPRRWVAWAGTLAASAVIVAAVAWLWPSRSAQLITKELITKEPALASTVPAKREPATPAPAAAAPAPPARTIAARGIAQQGMPAQAGAQSVTRIDLDATAPTWVSLMDGGGNKLLAELLVPGAPRSFELTNGGTLRAGNAGGLVLRVDGRPVAPLGAMGQVREVRIKDGKVLGSPQ